MCGISMLINRHVLSKQRRALLHLRPTRDEYMFGALVVLALGLRLWGLGDRPMHYDESLHAYYSWDLFVGNGMRHEPWIHGPLQFFLNAAVFAMFWDNDYTARLIYCLFGAGLVGLPYFLRDYMGRCATLTAAAMFAVSPTLLYFSRYSRNDILMAFWALTLFVLTWRYLHDRKNRYLYIFAAVLALAFATKETAYILVVTFGVLLAVLSITQLIPLLLGRIRVSDITGPTVLFLLLVTLTLPQFAALSSIFQGLGGSDLILVYSSGPTVNPVGLPLWTEPFVAIGAVEFPLAIDILLLGAIAGISLCCVVLFRRRPILVLWSAVGMPIAMMIYVSLAMLNVDVAVNYLIAAIILAGLVLISFAVGIMWQTKTWLISAGIFYAVWVSIYTSFFGLWVRAYTECPGSVGGIPGVLCTKFGGAFTGVWQGLGYWLAQQAVARGNQPWYYYFTIGSLYEFLPLTIGVIGIIYYLKNGGVLGLFLVFWALSTFLIYTIASEKMPWLLVNLTVPFILLSAKLLSDFMLDLSWRRMLSEGHILLLLAFPLLLILMIYLFTSYLDKGEIFSLNGWASAIGLIVGLVVVVSLMYRAKLKLSFRLSILGVAALMLGFSVFTAFRATYTEGDGRPEMLVYAGGSEDVRNVSNDLRVEFRNRDSNDRLHVDYELWYPLNWYVRNDQFIEYHCYKTIEEAGYVDWCKSMSESPPAAALLLLDSHGYRDSKHLMAYVREGPFKDLLWFPEVYRRPGEDRSNETMWEQLRNDFGFITNKMDHREAWKDVLDYFLHRRISKVWWDSKFFAYMPGGLQDR
ncbi:TIGR03663 family protein [SAR202 cluster bacterium AD-804-J14_MRT_500m]|nr:TIGR03663 family protein [SAR202 cluster bacterium AD-804-J14_MRT_500m]